MVHLLPHWNWEGREGQEIPVMVYSNADQVELFLNGKSLGKKGRFSDAWNMPVGKAVSADKKFVTRYRRIWQVPHPPGTLRAVAYHSGRPGTVAPGVTAETPHEARAWADPPPTLGASD